MRSVSKSVIPATGSSNNNSLGSCISNMPISNHCFCPWLKLPAWRRMSCVRWIVSKTSRSLSDCTPSNLKNIEAATPLWVLSANSKFSNTLKCSNTVGFWNLRPMPNCAISGSLWRSKSIVLPKKTWPESGLVLPVMMSIMVVLPAPLGPMMQRNSPGAISSDKWLIALNPSKLTLTSSKYKILPCVVSNSPLVWMRP